ncbi:protein HflC [Arenimonas maotaiensis]|uniref:Protein HflC n=1 Tax=Arenimonas maotaiensis TaxID=1446479 RepID=A0A917CKH0_9GAMM|nr:protease modulator HflC [Arenimonas maotaiensis]GGF91620.1 protein HflC [Arenimonas maotaiensis]
MRNPTPFLAAGALAVLALFASVYVVNESQTAIVLNLGKVVRNDVPPGLHFKVPFVEQVRKFDRRLLTLDDNPERYLTAEKKDVEVDFFVKWKIKDVTTYYRAAGGGNEEAAKQRLTPIVKNALRNDINQLTLQQVVSSGRNELTKRLLKQINAGAATLGIEVVDVRIKRINFPQDSQILDSVFDRMSTERQQVANALRAEGQELAESVRAEAERESQVILAEAQREAQKVRGAGDSEVARISAAAYGQDAEFYAFYRSLEAYKASFADGKTTMVLDPDSEYLKYFGGGKR